MLVPMTPGSSVSVISTMDPAIDRERSTHGTVEFRGEQVECLEYINTRLIDPTSWRRSVVFVDGESPTEFVIGVIPPAELNRIEDECVGAETQRNWRCFLHGIRDIVNAPSPMIIREGGGEDDVPKILVDGLEYVRPSWLRMRFVRGLRKVALEIGLLAYWWNQVQDADVKN